MSVEHIAFPHSSGYEPTEQELRNYAIGPGQAWEVAQIRRRRTEEFFASLYIFAPF